MLVVSNDSDRLQVAVQFFFVAYVGFEFVLCVVVLLSCGATAIASDCHLVLKLSRFRWYGC